MARLVGIVSLLFLMVGIGAGQAQPRTVILPKGTILKFWTAERITSATAKVGDDVVLYMARPLRIGSETVMPSGYIAHARVSEARPGGTNCQYAHLFLAIDHVTLPDSKVASVELVGLSEKSNFEYVPPEKTGELKRGSKLRAVLTAPILIVSAPIILPMMAIAMRNVEKEDCKKKQPDGVFPAKSTVLVRLVADQAISVGP